MDVEGRELRVVRLIGTNDGERAEHAMRHGRDLSLERPRRIGLDAKGRVYGIDDSGVHVFSPSGKFLFNHGGIAECCGMAVRADGTVLVIANMDSRMHLSVVRRALIVENRFIVH